MNLLQLDPFDFERELTAAFKVRGTFPDEYVPFESVQVIDRSINAFLDAIASIDSQLDEDDGFSYVSDESDWARRARGAKRQSQQRKRCPREP